MDYIYQASDLAAKRRELIDAARVGVAQIRDTDGAGLVMLPQHRFEFLSALREQFSRFVSLEGALERPLAERRVSDLGDFAWLAAFDEDDQRTFRTELIDALMQSLSTDTLEPTERCIAAWRTTARALSNDKSRRVLTAPGDADDAFTEISRPE